MKFHVPSSVTLSTTLVARLRGAIMRGELPPGTGSIFTAARGFRRQLIPLREALCVGK